MATWIRVLLVVTIVAVALTTAFDYPGPQTGFATPDTICNLEVNDKVKIGSDYSSEFGNELDNDDICLTDETIYLGGDSINTEEILFFNHKSKSGGPHSALTANDDDYDNIVLESQAGPVKLFYTFENRIDLTQATADDPVRIHFLGEEWLISNVEDSIATAVTGQSFFLTQGSTATVDGVRVKLEQISNSGSAAVTVDGVHEVIADGKTKMVKGLQITNTDPFYAHDSSSTTLTIGKDSLITIRDGDYVNIPDPTNTTTNWRWDVGNLESTDPTTTSTSVEFSGPYIGIELADERVTNPGECIGFPNNYIEICNNGLTSEDYTRIDINKENLDTGSGVVDTTYFRANDNELRFGGKRLTEAWVDSTTIYYEESGGIQSTTHSGLVGSVDDIDITLAGGTYTFASPESNDDIAFAFSGSSLNTVTWNGRNIKSADGKLITKHGVEVVDIDDDELTVSIPNDRVEVSVTLKAAQEFINLLRK